MKFITFCATMFFSYSVAAGGPTSVAGINIGMSKAEYLSIIGITPVDCNAYVGRDGKATRLPLKSLRPEHKSLCYGWAHLQTGSIESIQIEGISYDVVEASASSSNVFKQTGGSSKAIFLGDRLISLEIIAPNVSLETLQSKYGPPEISDFTKVESCTNRLGNEFKYKSGNLDAIWKNGDVRAVLRGSFFQPRNTCSAGQRLVFYIIEERKQVEIIETAIINFRKENVKSEATSSPF